MSESTMKASRKASAKTMRRSSNALGLYPQFAVAEATALPKNYAQYKDSIPTGIQASVSPADIKLTAKSLRRAVARGATIGTFNLRVPIKNNLFLVQSIFELIYAAGTNYQLQHDDAYFQYWYDLAIFSPEEKQKTVGSGENATTVEVDPLDDTLKMRRMLPKLAERLAEKIAQYIYDRTKLDAALANILILSRLNGTGPTAVFADADKAARVNTAFGNAAQFAAVKGMQDIILSWTRFATGKTNFGGDIVAIPRWNVSVTGNNSFHALPIDNLFTCDPNNPTNGVVTLTDGSSTNPEVKAAQDALTNLYDTYNEYVSGTGGKTIMKDGYKPSNAKVENAGRIIVQQLSSMEAFEVNATADDNWVPPTSQRLRKATSDLESESGNDDNIISRDWCNADYWYAKIQHDYPEMKQEDSALRTFCDRELGLFEKSKTIMDMNTALRGMINFELNDLLMNLVYKHGNPVTTAVIVEHHPFRHGSDGSYTASDVFEKNFNRYHLYSRDSKEILNEARKWKTDTPTVFHPAQEANGNPVLPIVLNALPTASSEMANLKGSFASGRTTNFGGNPVTITGKYATLFDYTVHTRPASAPGNVYGAGVDAEYLKQFVEGCDDAIVFEEDERNIWVATTPILDNTDPMNCGFTVMISRENDGLSAEWARYFTDPKNFTKLSGQDGTYVADSAKTFVPCIEGTVKVDGKDTTKYLRMHTSNPDYVDVMKHPLIFIGCSVFTDPRLKDAYAQAGYLWGSMESAADSGGTSPLAEVFGSIATGTENIDVTTRKLVGMTTQKVGDERKGDESSNVLFARAAGSEKAFCAYAYFAPQYGLVPIALDMFETTGVRNIIPLPIDSSNKEGADSTKFVPTTAAFTPAAAQIGIDGGAGTDKVDALLCLYRAGTYNTLYVPNAEVLSFLKAFSVPVFTIDEFGMPTDISEAVNEITVHMDTLARWITSLLVPSKVAYAGQGKVRGYEFRDMPSANPDSPSTIRGTAAMPVNNIITEPRVARDKQSPRAHGQPGDPNGGHSTSSNSKRKPLRGGAETPSSVEGISNIAKAVEDNPKFDSADKEIEKIVSDADKAKKKPEEGNDSSTGPASL